MPSIGAVTAMIITRRIDNAIRRTFEGKQRDDAFTLLDLSARGGDRSFILVAMLAALFTALTSAYFLRPGGFVVAIIAGATLLLATFVGVRRQRKARGEMRTLIATDPAYWGPISAKLQEIVLAAGGFSDGLGPSQATKIIR